jgi:surface polysaccharide O-acyltransferase-like enzyme
MRTTIGWRISIHRRSRGIRPYGLTFAMFSAAMTFTVPAVFPRFARSSLWLLDAMRPSAFGIYLLHFIFLIWLQYIVYDPGFPVLVKFAIVFIGTLSMSWALTVLLRKIALVARAIWGVILDCSAVTAQKWSR